MMLGMAAATSALDLIKTLTNSQSSSKTATQSNFAVDPQKVTTNLTASSGQPGLISADTMNALFQAQTDDALAAKRNDALNSLFKTLDADGSGQISKGEFEAALGAGGTNVANADKVFGKMDADGDGSISRDEMAAALKPKKAHAPHGQKGGPQDALMQMLDATNSSQTTNSDGSTTSTMTLADGSTVTLTTPAASSASSGATRAYHAIEQMVQRQADRMARTANVTSSLSVSV